MWYMADDERGWDFSTSLVIVGLGVLVFPSKMRWNKLGNNLVGLPTFAPGVTTLQS